MTPILRNPDELVRPRFFTHPDYVQTIGPEVADLGALCGMTANPEQRLLLDAAFGMDKRGRIPFEVALLASRQNLKTGFLVLQALGKAVLLRRELQIWTAHKDSATDEAFRDFEQLIDGSSELSRRVKRLTHGKGDKSIEFLNGARIVYRARTGKGGQALSADDIDLDEAFAVEPQHVGSFMPTMSTRPNAQITYASSAPHAVSGYLRSIMARGRAGHPRMVYAEWTVERVIGEKDGQPVYGPPSCREPDCDHALIRAGCICDDPELVKLANPSLERSAPPSISWEYIQSERGAMAEIVEMYLRERMGIGERPDSVGGAIAPDLWAARSRVGPTPAPAAIGVAVDLDRIWASIGVVGGSVLGAFRRDRLGPWVYDEAIRIAGEYGIPVGVDGRGPAASMIQPLRDAGVDVVESTTEDYILTCAELYDGLADGRYEHGDHDELNAAVAVAGWRWIGDRRVWARSGGDISMLEAVTMALRASREPVKEASEPWFAFGYSDE